MSKQHHVIASADFSNKVRNRLTKQGVYVIGIQMVPMQDGSGEYKCYCLDNSDMHQVRSLYQVLEMAGEPVPSWVPAWMR